MIAYSPFRIIGSDADDDGRFTFQIEASNNNLDSYFTHFTERSLRNFARDASGDGVQFLDSHNSNNLGYGRTFNGRLQRPTDREPVFEIPDNVELAINPPNRFVRALLDVFTTPGINFGGGLTFASTDDFIRAVKSEIVKDVSVGFSGGNWSCDICGNNYLRYRDCQHFAGMVYPAGDAGERQLLATVTIDKARLHEVSAVYDGATPDAMIRKAQQAIRSDSVDNETKDFLKVRYKIEHGSIFPVVESSKNSVAEDKRTEEPEENNNMEFEQLIRTALAESNAPADIEPVQQIEWLIVENGRLQPLAETGEQYRADLIEAAIEDGVRALGQEFNKEHYEKMLSDSSIEDIKTLRADWQRIAKERLPHGRKTEDKAEERKESDPLPLSLYRI